MLSWLRQRQVEIEEERRIELEREKLRRDFEAASRPHVIDSSPSLKQPVLQTRNQSLKTNDRLGETDHISVHGEKAKSTEEEGLVVYQLAEMQKLEESCSLSETRCIELLEQIKSLLTAATQLEADSRSPDGNKSKGQKEAPFIPIVYTVESLGPAVKEADIFTKHEATSNQNLVSIPSLEHKHKQRNTAELEISDKLSLWKRAGNQFRKLSVIKKPGGSENAWMVDGDEEDEEEKKEEKE